MPILLSCGESPWSPEENEALEERLMGQWIAEAGSERRAYTFRDDLTYTRAFWKNTRLETYKVGEWRVRDGDIVMLPSHHCTFVNQGWKMMSVVGSLKKKIVLKDNTLKISTKGWVHSRGNYDDPDSPCLIAK